MRLLNLGYCLIFFSHIQAGDPLIPTWTALQKTLENSEQLKIALQENGLPNDNMSLVIIGEFIKNKAPKSKTGSPCCLKRNVEIDPTLEELITFHKLHVSSLKERRKSNTLSENERDSLYMIENDVEKMSKKIRRSYEELPTSD